MKMSRKWYNTSIPIGTWIGGEDYQEYYFEITHVIVVLKKQFFEVQLTEVVSLAERDIKLESIALLNAT